MSVDDDATEPSAPGRGATFLVDPRRTLTYRFCRGAFKLFLRVWFRPRVTGSTLVPDTGPVILAPVHRSFLDFGFMVFLTNRKLFFMAKDSLWKNRMLGAFLLAMGAFPVHRESADREALRHAEEVLNAGLALVLFPEGTRQEGAQVAPLLEGASFLSARTGAPVVPIGIGGSDRAMAKGSTIPKPVAVHLTVGTPHPAPPKSERGRVSRSTVKQGTVDLQNSIQEVYDRARQGTISS